MFRLKKGLFFNEIGKELLIYDTETKETYILNETGKEIFNLLDGNTFSMIVDRLTQEYAVDESIITKDMNIIIDALKKVNFLFEI